MIVTAVTGSWMTKLPFIVAIKTLSNHNNSANNKLKRVKALGMVSCKHLMIRTFSSAHKWNYQQ